MGGHDHSHGHGGHGDHGHHDHHHDFKIPDWKQYKVEDAPELVTLRNMLAAKGLKDPWIRNEVWRFDRKQWGTSNSRWLLTAGRGFRWGFLAFLATITIDQGLKMINPPSDHHSSNTHH